MIIVVCLKAAYVKRLVTDIADNVLRIYVYIFECVYLRVVETRRELIQLKYNFISLVLL